MARVRSDIALTMAVAALVGLGAQGITMKAVEATNRPQEYISQTVIDGTVGAQADDTVVRAATVEEIKAQEGLFTIALERGDYHSIFRTDGFYYIRLEDGDYVMAQILRDSVQNIKEPNHAGTLKSKTLLPIGQIVNEPVPENVLEEVAGYYDPADDSFYIDMRGTHEGGYLYKPRSAKKWGENAFLTTTLISFFILRWITVKLGLFPPILSPKKKKSE